MWQILVILLIKTQNFPVLMVQRKKLDANRAVQIYKDMRRRMRTGLHGILGFSLRQTNNKTKPAHEIHIYFSI